MEEIDDTKSSNNPEGGGERKHRHFIIPLSNPKNPFRAFGKKRRRRRRNLIKGKKGKRKQRARIFYGWQNI